MGMRKPSLIRSFIAITTSICTLQANEALIAVYSKKGMECLENPKKAVSNTVNHMITFEDSDLFKSSKKQLKKVVYILQQSILASNCKQQLTS